MKKLLMLAAAAWVLNELFLKSPAKAATRPTLQMDPLLIQGDPLATRVGGVRTLPGGFA